MNRNVRLGALFGALAMIFALATAWADDKPQWIPLRDGLKARLLNTLEYMPEGGGEREVLVNFMLSDPSVIGDHAKVIDVADQLFGRIVMTPADSKGFRRAAVQLLISEQQVGDSTIQTYEDFHYARRDDGVWLRQAGPESWKQAQDPAAWAPPASEEVKLSVGTIYVDFIGEIFAPPGATRALGIEVHSATSVLDVQSKYAEMKELWGRVDRDGLKEKGFDLVRMENYGEPQLGRFQVRQMVYLNIRRDPNGDWPGLPDQMPGAPLVAWLGSDVADEATVLAATAIASVVSARPVASLAARSGNVSAGVGVGREGLDAKMPADLREYLDPGK